MRIILTFLLNAGLNFGVGLAVAAVLGPAGYGRYAVGASAGALLATALFDWLRLSATRFYGEAQRGFEPGLRATLDALYLAGAGTLATAALLALAVPLPFGVTAGFATAIALTAVANGAFDFRTALARARFDDGAYSVLVIGKGVFGFALALGAAFFSHDPLLTLSAQAFGTLVAILPVRTSLAEPRRGEADRKLARRFAAYGLPIVTANAIFQAIMLLNRSVAAGRFGFAGAGHLSLALDIEMRLLLAVGAAVDVLLFQLAVRSEAAGGSAAGQVQVRSNIVHVAAVLLLVTVGVAGTLPALAALVVPARFQDGFMPLALAALPGVALFCIGQFAVNPVFQMAHRTAPIIAGAAAAAALDGAGLMLLPNASGPLGLAVVHTVSLGAGFVLLTVLALRDPGVRPRQADVIGLVIAGASAFAAMWPTRWITVPFAALCAGALVGGTVYLLVLVLLDVGEVRAVVRDLIGRARHKVGAVHLA